MMRTIYISRLITLAILLVLAAAAFGQANVESKVDEYISGQMQSRKIPGVAVAVIRDGKVIHSKGYGHANVEHRVPVTPNTVFQSGSVGKAFTVMAIMMLVDDGKVHLDDSVNQYFPDAPPAWSKITIRHWLQHTSGMTGYPANFDMRIDRTEQDLYAVAKTVPLMFEVGEKRGYSNLGFVMLGFLIRKVTGKTYGEFLQERIFDPLKMTTARVISEADIVPNRAAGYRLVEGQLRNQEWVAPTLNTTADGALYLSVLDVAKWEAALADRKLLSKNSYDAMWNNLVTNDGMSQPYGFSWQIERINGQRIIEHSGGWQGFTANFSRYPAKNLAVIVFTNLRGTNPISLTRGVQELYHPELSIEGATPIKDEPREITEFVKELLLKICTKKLTKELFVSPTGDEILSHSDAAASEFTSYGQLAKIELIDREVNDHSSRYSYRLTYPNKVIVLTIGLAKDLKINALDLRRS